MSNFRRTASAQSAGELIVRSFSAAAQEEYSSTDTLEVYEDFLRGGYWLVDCGCESYFPTASDLEKDLEARADWVVLPSGDDVSFQAAIALMDDGIREKVHAELAPCGNQAFLDRYCRLHEEAYGEEFTV